MGLFDLFGKITPDKFAQLMIKAFRKEGYDKSVEYDADSFSLILDKECRLFLGNVYNEYNHTHRSERNFILKKYANATITINEAPVIPDSFEEAKSGLLPRIRDNAYYQYNQMIMKADGIDRLPLYYIPFAEHLSVELCYDMKHSTCSIAQDHLTKWGFSFEEALDVARDNMWSISNDDFQEIMPGLYLSPWQDAHDASRMFLYDLIWQTEVKGDPVVTIPDKDHLLISGADDEAGLQALALSTKEVLQNTQRPITGQPYRLEGTHWVPYLPAADHPAYDGLTDVRKHTMCMYYEFQKEAMDKLYPKEGINIYVANILYCQDKKTQNHFTVSTWSDVPALLPQTDKVSFTGPDSKQDVIFVDWDVVMEIAGDQMKIRDDLIPTRYEVNGLPSSYIMKRLKERSVSVDQ